MAFTIKQIKKILSDAGTPVENLESAASDICGRHAADMEALKEERDGYRADAEKNAKAQAELDEMKARPSDQYKEKYEKEKAAYKKYREEVEKRESDAAKRKAYTEILKDAGIAKSKIEKVLKYTDLDKMELDENGNLANGKELMKEVKAEWPEFIEKQVEQGAKTPTPPDSTGGQAVNSRAFDIWNERQNRLYGKIEGNENK